MRRTQRVKRNQTPMRPNEKKTDLKPVTPEAARKRFNSVVKDKERDLNQTAAIVAPAKAKSTEDIKLQRRWYKNPGALDFEGVDTAEKPGYRLPSGERMKVDEYPRVVQWKQGNMQYQLDLKTGKHTVSSLKGQRARKVRSPQRTLKVVSTSKEKPKEGDFKIGFVRLSVSKDDISFAVDQNLASGRRDFRDKQFQHAKDTQSGRASCRERV